MEVKYSNFAVDKRVFDSTEINGLYEENSNYIYNHIYDVKEVEANLEKFVFKFLAFFPSKRLNKIKHDLVNILFEKERFNKIKLLKLKELSSTELMKAYMIKALCLGNKTVILEHIDSFFTRAEIKSIITVIKNNLKELDKTIILTSNNADNLIELCGNYIIVKDDKIEYSGSDFTQFKDKSDLVRFVDLANQKGANLGYYKDSNDLLKAIYRSVTR